MTEKRYRKLMNNPNETLTEAERNEWHFCMDWDGLLIHNDSEEAKVCTCDFNPLRTNIKEI